MVSMPFPHCVSIISAALEVPVDVACLLPPSQQCGLRLSFSFIFLCFIHPSASLKANSSSALVMPSLCRRLRFSTRSSVLAAARVWSTGATTSTTPPSFSTWFVEYASFSRTLCIFSCGKFVSSFSSVQPALLAGTTVLATFRVEPEGSFLHTFWATLSLPGGFSFPAFWTSSCFSSCSRLLPSNLAAPPHVHTYAWQSHTPNWAYVGVTGAAHSSPSFSFSHSFPPTSSTFLCPSFLAFFLLLFWLLLLLLQPSIFSTSLSASLDLSSSSSSSLTALSSIFLSILGPAPCLTALHSSLPVLLLTVFFTFSSRLCIFP